MLKKKKTSNGVRHQLNLKKFLLCKKINLVKSMLFSKKKFNGRSSGRITVRHKGGGVKQSFKKLNFCLDFRLSILLGIFYDSKRSSFISLSFNLLNHDFNYCLTTKNTFPGSILCSYITYPELRLATIIQIKKVPAGSLIHSIHTHNKITYIKSAGVFGIVVQKDNIFCKVKMPSGNFKNFDVNSLCVLGSLSNSKHSSVILGKAGRSRLKNKRPVVRGVAMNPVDHPHGGQTSGGIPSVTPWGIPTKGKPTKNKKNVKSKVERSYLS